MSSSGTSFSNVVYTPQINSSYNKATVTDNSIVLSGTLLAGTNGYGWVYNAYNNVFTAVIDKPFTVTFSNFGGNTNYFYPFIYYNNNTELNSWTTFSKSYAPGEIKLSFFMSSQLFTGGISFDFSITT